jgi:hypothetical protein
MMGSKLAGLEHCIIQVWNSVLIDCFVYIPVVLSFVLCATVRLTGTCMLPGMNITYGAMRKKVRERSKKYLRALLWAVELSHI